MSIFQKIGKLGNCKNIEFYLSILVFVVFFVVVYALSNLQNVFQYNPDEGYYFMRAFLENHGFVLYEEIWMDQPPVLVKLIAGAFRVFEPSIVVARCVVLLMVSAMMMAIFYLVAKTQNIWSAFLTMALICTIPNFFRYSVATMNGLPAIALAVFACVAIYQYQVHRKWMFLILSALCLALGLQTKLFVAVFVPAILVELIWIECQRGSGRIGVGRLLPGLIWGLCLFLFYGAIAWIFNIDYAQIFQPFSLAKQHFVEAPFESTRTWVKRSPEIVLLGLASLLCVRKATTQFYFIPLITTVTSFFIFSFHTPVWDHHRLLMLIPGAWFASFGVSELCTKSFWSGLKSQSISKNIFKISKLVYIGLVFLLFVFHLKPNVYEALHSFDKTLITDVQPILDLINQHRTDETILVTDTPSFAFHTQTMIPPELSTISKKQTRTGLITAQGISRIVFAGQVDLILWSRFPELGEQVMQQVGSRYELIFEDKHARLYRLDSKANSMQKYLGFGGDTVGGKGGQVYTVTNLKPDGPGSFREAVDHDHPRVVTFSVSGTINVVDPIVIQHPYITIDGASAPESGITLSGAGIKIQTSEVIVSNLRIRVGDRLEGYDPEDRDGFSIYLPLGADAPIKNVVIDHCSVSWAIDENIGTWIDGDASVSHITISHNIISEGLKNSIHPEGQHSMGLLIGDGITKVSVIGNVFAHNNARNPQLKGGSQAEILSNVIYNAGQPAIGLSDSARVGAIQAHMINNYFIPGQNTKHLDKHISVNTNVSMDSEIFILGNHIANRNVKQQDDMILFKGERDQGQISQMKSKYPFWFIDPIEANYGLERILDQAGARRNQRDVVDQRIISDITYGTGVHIDTPPVSNSTK